MILLAATALQVFIGIVIAKEHIVALTIDSTRCGLHHELTEAIAIQVPSHKRRGVSRVEHVMARVEHPQTGAVELIAAVESR